MNADDALRELGLPGGDLHELPGSEKRFPDGAQYRIEIPSTEGPACLKAVIDEAELLHVPVHRVSQGSGVFMLTDRELDEIVATAAKAKIEVSLFARPNAGWDTSAATLAPAGGAFAAAVRGQDQLAALLEDVLRASEHGIRSVLLADLGALVAFSKLRANGVLPADMQAKISVMFPIANAATARLLTELGASTLNLQPDLTLAQVAAIREAVDVPIDFYIEAPDTLGGFIRMHEIPELIRIAAPIYLKFGLRNAPDIYPSGSHLEPTAVALSRERVRRARLGLELLERSRSAPVMSEVGAAGLALPTPTCAPAVSPR